MRKIKGAFATLTLALFLSGSTIAHAEPETFRENQTLTTAEIEDPQIPQGILPLEEAPPPPIPVRELLLQQALAQVGIAQDCTDLVQNSLAALGYTVRRDQGGFDYGVRQLAAFGVPIPASEALPGDIAITGPDNGGHVWIILDPATNTGVHGGWSGNTVVGNNGVPISAHLIIRVP